MNGRLSYDVSRETLFGAKPFKRLVNGLIETVSKWKDDVRFL
jgi:hypothetical protein